jgi:hypothetical protein
MIEATDKGKYVEIIHYETKFKTQNDPFMTAPLTAFISI